MDGVVIINKMDNNSNLTNGEEIQQMISKHLNKLLEDGELKQKYNHQLKLVDGEKHKEMFLKQIMEVEVGESKQNNLLKQVVGEAKLKLHNKVTLEIIGE